MIKKVFLLLDKNANSQLFLVHSLMSLALASQLRYDLVVLSLIITLALNKVVATKNKFVISFFKIFVECNNQLSKILHSQNKFLNGFFEVAFLQNQIIES